MLDKGDEVTGCPNGDDLVLRSFFAGPVDPPGTLAGGEREGATSRTGASCGERSELMSMMGTNVERRYTPNKDLLDLREGFHQDQSRQAHARIVLRSTLRSHAPPVHPATDPSTPKQRARSGMKQSVQM